MRNIKDTIELVFLIIVNFLMAILIGITNIISSIAKLIVDGISYIGLIIKYPRDHEKVTQQWNERKERLRKEADIKEIYDNVFSSVTQMQVFMNLWLEEYYNENYKGNKFPLQLIDKEFYSCRNDALHAIYTLRHKGYDFPDKEWVKKIEALNYNSYSSKEEINAIYPKYDPEFGKHKVD